MTNLPAGGQEFLERVRGVAQESVVENMRPKDCIEADSHTERSLRWAQTSMLKLCECRTAMPLRGWEQKERAPRGLCAWNRETMGSNAAEDLGLG